MTKDELELKIIALIEAHDSLTPLINTGCMIIPFFR